MKKSKKSHAIIVLIVLLLALAIGYAAFSSTLTINGTASGTSDWEVVFESATLRDAEGAVDREHGTASVTTTTNTNDTITAQIELAYPGDGVILEAVVKNNGSVPAELTNFEITGDTSDANFEIVPSTIAEGEVIDAGGSCTAQFAIKWKTDSTATDLGTKTFTITYNYTQDTTEFTGTPTHTDA